MWNERNRPSCGRLHIEVRRHVWLQGVNLEVLCRLHLIETSSIPSIQPPHHTCVCCIWKFAS